MKSAHITIAFDNVYDNLFGEFSSNDFQTHANEWFKPLKKTQARFKYFECPS